VARSGRLRTCQIDICTAKSRTVKIIIDTDEGEGMMLSVGPLQGTKSSWSLTRHSPTILPEWGVHINQSIYQSINRLYSTFQHLVKYLYKTDVVYIAVVALKASSLHLHLCQWLSWRYENRLIDWYVHPIQAKWWDCDESMIMRILSLAADHHLTFIIEQTFTLGTAPCLLSTMDVSSYTFMH
jgi:hypothetical protein